MTITEAILRRVEALPDSAKAEVLNFVEFLESKRAPRQEGLDWSGFSLSSAMRGMEEEDSPYTLDDLKESFR